MRIAIGLLRGLGDPPGPSPESVINDVLHTWQTVGATGVNCPAPSPDQIAQNLRQSAQSTCITWPAQCPNGIPEAAIANAADFYATMIHWDGSKAALCPVAAPAPVTAGPAPQVYVAPAIVPQTSAAPQATALTPSQVMPASNTSPIVAPSPAPASTDYLATVKAWLGSTTYGLPNLALLLGALAVGYYFYTKRGTRR